MREDAPADGGSHMVLPMPSWLSSVGREVNSEIAACTAELVAIQAKLDHWRSQEVRWEAEGVVSAPDRDGARKLFRVGRYFDNVRLPAGDMLQRASSGDGHG